MRCFDIDFFKEHLHKKYKPPKYKFFSHGTKLGNSLLTRLRVDRSYLNSHAFSIGLAPSPQCNCGARQETTLHMLNFCPLFASGRRYLFDFVGQLVSPFSKLNQKDKMFTLLYGYKSDNRDYDHINTQITLAVQNFLIKTKRFQYWSPLSYSKPNQTPLTSNPLPYPLPQTPHPFTFISYLHNNFSLLLILAPICKKSGTGLSKLGCLALVLKSLDLPGPYSCHILQYFYHSNHSLPLVVTCLSFPFTPRVKIVI